jgi:transcriptional regulator with XRE-family HTH domain
VNATMRENESVAPYAANPAQIGRTLKMWRALRRVKQAHAAELFGVSQTTISRWESGAQGVEEDRRVAIMRVLEARLDSAADRQLAMLVARSNAPIHLVCDLTHRLLALSPRRARDCKVAAATLIGASLWPHASESIIALERDLPDLGWLEPAPPVVEGATGPNASDMLVIRPSRFRYTRFQLSSGGHARLVETIEADD